MSALSIWLAPERLDLRFKRPSLCWCDLLVSVAHAAHVLMNNTYLKHAYLIGPRNVSHLIFVISIDSCLIAKNFCASHVCAHDKWQFYPLKSRIPTWANLAGWAFLTILWQIWIFGTHVNIKMFSSFALSASRVCLLAVVPFYVFGYHAKSNKSN